MHSQNALLEVEHERGPLRLFVRGSGFNELRHNGTPYQFNGTRLVRYATGGDWQNAQRDTLGCAAVWLGRALPADLLEHLESADFGQSDLQYRCGETPTKFSFVPDNELGAAAHWSQPLGAGLLLVAGADVHDVRVWDHEQSFGSTAAHYQSARSPARLRRLRRSHVGAQGMDGDRLGPHGLVPELRWAQAHWNGSAWMPSATQPPQYGQRLFDPRLGLTRKLGEHWALSASGFRAFRAPTPNELYRSTQVGNKLTKPNDSLLSERATGWETGVATQRRWGTVRASYFLTQVNRPITAVRPTRTPRRFC